MTTTRFLPAVLLTLSISFQSASADNTVPQHSTEPVAPIPEKNEPEPNKGTIFDTKKELLPLLVFLNMLKSAPPSPQ